MRNSKIARYLQEVANWVIVDEGPDERLRHVALEERLLFSATAAPTELLAPSPAMEVAEFVGQVQDIDDLQTDISETQFVSELSIGISEIVFVDGQVEDYQSLLAGLEAEGIRAEVVILDPELDGLTQISDVLADRANISAIHIVSHGTDGQLQLGSEWLNAQNIADRAEELSGWRDSLTHDADILIYGCDLAGSESGREVLSRVSDYTGADVAASTNLTGDSALGADWVLEYEIGLIDTDPTLWTEATAGWNGTLNFAPELLISTEGFTVNPGDPSDGFSRGAVVELSDLTPEPVNGTSEGTFTSLFDFQSFDDVPENNLTGLHYVQSDILIGDASQGGTTTQLFAGDLLFSVSESATFTSLNSESIERGDIGLFRPASVGDYSAGTFSELIDDLAPAPTGSASETVGITAFTLVEQTTTVENFTFNAGDFIFGQDRPGNHDVFVVTPIHTGPGVSEGAPLGPISLLIDMAEPNAIDGLELLEQDATIGGHLFSAGTILASTWQQGFSPSITFESHDIVTLTPIDDGNGGFVIDIEIVFEGIDLGLDLANNNNDIDALTTLPNFAPDANDDAEVGLEDTPLSFSISGNDSDPDGDTLVFNTTPVSVPSNGLVSIDPSGNVVYIPNAGFSGTDSFEYEVSDGNGGTDIATVDIVIEPANEGPDAVDDAYTLDEGSVLNQPVGTLLLNDTDPEGDSLSASLFTNATFGSVVVNAGGSFSYIPNANFNGSDSFKYQVADGNGGFDVAEVTLTVLPVNDAPDANDDSYSGAEDVVLSRPAGTLLANDTDPDGDSLTAFLVNNAAFGNVIVNADGSFDYTPNTNFVGTDSFVYEVSDGNGGTDTATVTLFIDGVNDPPVAGNDSFVTDEDLPLIQLVGSLTSNDSDLEGDDLTTSFETGPSNGSVVVNADGSFEYTPNEDYFGTDSFIYRVADGNDGFDTATVSIIVRPVNDSPVAVNDPFTTNEDTGVSVPPGTLTLNDTDVDSTVLVTALGMIAPSNGTVVVNADGSFQYTPFTNFTGTDSFTYTVSDGAGGLDVGTVNLTIVAVNDAPVAMDDPATTDEDTAVTISVLDNDMDVDLGDGLSVVSIASPAQNGSVSIASNGDLVYVPDADFFGTDSFVYRVSDGTTSDTGLVTVTVSPTPDAPTAVDDALTTNQGVALVGNVLANDSDADGGSIVVDSFTLPGNGTLALGPNGNFTYTPNLSFSGIDSFTYTVVDPTGRVDTATVGINVIAVNSVPVATDDAFILFEDIVFNGDVSANDFDPDNNPVSFSLLAGPSNGSITINSDGTFVYTPNLNFNGDDSFTYEIVDSFMQSSTGEVSLAIKPQNDPVVALNDFLTTDEDIAVSGNVLINDSDADGEPISVGTALASLPANGTVVIDTLGNFSYTPDADFFGTDTFIYTATDGVFTTTAQVFVNVSPVVDTPNALPDAFSTPEDRVLTGNLLVNDSDPDGGTLAAQTVPSDSPDFGSVVIFANGTFVYTPNQDFVGTDTFSYVVVDDTGLTATETATIQVVPVNDAAVANPDEFTIAEDTLATGNLLANDFDVDGDGLSISVNPTVAPENGTVLLSSDGTFVYTPNADFFGIDTFEYEVTDGLSPATSTTVTIEVQPVTDDVSANDDTFLVNEDRVISGNVLANDIHPDGDSIFANPVLVEGPSNGTVTLAADGTFVYEPNPNFNGVDRFQYEVADGNGSTATAQVAITVAAVNDRPEANDDEITVTSGETFRAAAGTLQGNDVDVEGTESLTTSLVQAPSFGAVTVNDDGSLVYTPNDGFIGIDSFSYQVIDAAGASDIATVQVTVTMPPAPPGTPPVDQFDDSDPDESVDEEEASDAPLVSDAPTNDDPLQEESSRRRTPVATAPPPEAVEVLPTSDSTSASDTNVISDAARAGLDGVRRTVRTVAEDAVSTILVSSVSGPSAAIAIQQTQTLLAQDLDGLRETFNASFDLEAIEVAVETGLAGSLTVGYVFWVTRAGFLLSTLLPTLPTWQMMNPICILDAAASDGGNKETLQSIIKKSQSENEAKHKAKNTQKRQGRESSLAAAH